MFEGTIFSRRIIEDICDHREQYLNVLGPADTWVGKSPNFCLYRHLLYQELLGTFIFIKKNNQSINC